MNDDEIYFQDEINHPLDFYDIGNLNINLEFDKNNETRNENSDQSFFKDIGIERKKSNNFVHEMNSFNDSQIEIIQINSSKRTENKSNNPNNNSALARFSNPKEDTDAIINDKIRRNILKELGTIEFLLEKDIDILIQAFRKNGLRSYKEACSKGYYYDFDSKKLSQTKFIEEERFSFEEYAHLKRKFESEIYENSKKKIRNETPLTKLNRKIN